jgi:hypothetical protein
LYREVGTNIIKEGSPNATGTGDVSGPAGGVSDGDLVGFNGTGGKTIKKITTLPSGLTYTGLGTAAPKNVGDASGDVVMWKANGKLPFSLLSGTPTTLAGYGITDAYTKTQADSSYNAKITVYTFITGLFGGGTCSGYLKSDGTCDTPSAGTGTPGGASGNVQINANSKFGPANNLQDVAYVPVSLSEIAAGQQMIAIVLDGSNNPKKATTFNLTNASGNNHYACFDNSGNLVSDASCASALVALAKISGLGTNVATALAVAVGSAGAPVLLNGAGGTPSSMTGTNITGMPKLSSAVYGATTLAELMTVISNEGAGVETALGNAVNTAGGLRTDASSNTVTDASKTYSVQTPNANSNGWQLNNRGWDMVADASPQIVDGVAMTLNTGWVFTEMKTAAHLLSFRDSSGNAYYLDPSTNVVTGPFKNIYVNNAAAKRVWAIRTFSDPASTTGGLAWLLSMPGIVATVDSKFYGSN